MAEHRFTARSQGRDVPAVLWTPPEFLDFPESFLRFSPADLPGPGGPLTPPKPGGFSAPPRPSGPPGPSGPRQRAAIVLLGHGGGMHKATPEQEALASWLVRKHSLPVLAIDAPGHGERVSEEERTTSEDFSLLARHLRRPQAIDETIHDWQVALAVAERVVGTHWGPVGYWGVSMGTHFGLSLVAADPRMKGAVLGLYGLFGMEADRLRQDATRIRCPVLFLVQEDDELIPLENALDLYAALPAVTTRLARHAGGHIEVPEQTVHESLDFLARCLLGTPAFE